MAHYAKIESGIVTNVIVADEEFISTLPGTWIQTSYNTRGGVHYGQDGLPDDKEPLRKNYAGIGYIYDDVEDAFYIPRPSFLYELNKTTFLWDVRPEYTPLVRVSVISTLKRLPPVIPNESITIESTEIFHNNLVLFKNLSTDPNVYKYNQDTGIFENQNESSSTVIDSAISNIIYKFDGTKWVSTTLKE